MSPRHSAVVLLSAFVTAMAGTRGAVVQAATDCAAEGGYPPRSPPPAAVLWPKTAEPKGGIENE